MRRAAMILSPSLALLAWALAGCAAPEAQLEPDVLLRMQAEARGEIYDRENDLAIARNRLDEARARREQVLRRIDQLDERARKRQEQLARSGPKGAERAAKLGEPVAAERSYWEAQLRQLTARADVAEAQAEVAHARLEQTRQRELVRTGRALGRSMEPFDKSVESLDGKLRDEERREGDLRLETEKAYEKWKAAEDAYARATGDWDTTVWSE